MRELAALLVCLGCGSEEGGVVYGDEPVFPAVPFWDGVPEGGAAVVTDNFSDTLSIVDLATRELIGSVPVGLNPVEREGPHHDAVSPDGQSVYVGISNFVPGSGSGPHGAHGTGAADGHAVRLSAHDMATVQTQRISRSPGDVITSPDGERVFFSHFDLVQVQEAVDEQLPVEDTRAPIAVLDAVSLEIRDLVPVCAVPHGMRFSSDASELYVSCYGSDEVAIVDVGSLEVTRVPVADDVADPPFTRYRPNSVHVSPIDGRLWVALLGTNEIRVIDRETLTVDSGCSMSFGGWPLFGMFIDSGATFVLPVQGSPSSLVWVDTATCEEVAELELDPDDCVAAHMLLMGEAGVAGPAYLVCEGNHSEPGTFVFLDSVQPDAEVEAVVAVGVFPDGAALLYPGRGINAP